MNARAQLGELLLPGLHAAARPLHVPPDLDALLPTLWGRLTKGHASRATLALQRAALARFWSDPATPSFRDTCLLGWALTLPHRGGGACILEDGARFARLMDAVAAWHHRPNALRRAAQGLVSSYFAYDGLDAAAPPQARAHWEQLRGYLREQLPRLVEPQLNPAWLQAAAAHPELFTTAPGQAHAQALLHGDRSVVETLCADLGVASTSWLHRELARAQLATAVEFGHGAFEHALPRLLPLLQQYDALRDASLAALLERSALSPATQPHAALAAAARDGWGHPAADAADLRWATVGTPARSRVAERLHLECLERFFDDWTTASPVQQRRLAFWSRYVRRIGRLQVALAWGSAAAGGPRTDGLRRALAAPLGELVPGAGDQHALVITLGRLIAVEFSGPGQALYGYDAHASVPFDLARPLQLAVDARNSLKHKAPARILWLNHQDGTHGWERWEDMFETMLSDEFDIRCDGADAAPRRGTCGGEDAAFSRRALRAYAARTGLALDDHSPQGGSLWVRTGNSDPQVNRTLTQWRFHHLPGKGWWR